MQVNNRLQPDSDRIRKFFGEDASNEPFVMVNLLKFREKAEYADGRETALTGAQAYAIYGAGVAKIIESMGGRSVYAGSVTDLMIGDVEELWDMVALVEYPDSEAFSKMIASPEYQELHVHRDAGLAGQLNIRTKPGRL